MQDGSILLFSLPYIFMPSRNTISLLLVGVFFLQSFGMVSHAQEENDPEYDLQVQEDMQWVNSNDEFSQIEKSVEKPLVDTKTMKWSRKLALSYIDGLEPYDANWIWKSPKLIGKPIPYYTDDTSEPIVYEWKIHCITTKDCWSIVVASLEWEYRIMETSTSGKSNYERLGDNKKGNKNKLYYYSSIDQYIESNDGVNISIDTVNPWKKSSDLKTELSDKK